MQKKRGRPRAGKNNFSRPQTIKTAVAAGIFLSLALIKLFDPAGSKRLGGAVDEYIGDNTPSAMRAIGEALAGGEGIIDVFRTVFTGAGSEGVGRGDPDAPSGGDEDGEDRGMTKHPPPAGGTLFTKEGKNDGVAGDVGRGAPGAPNGGGFTPASPYSLVPVAYEGELISGGGFGIDDTLPLPFGYDAPPNVDFMMHTFGFEHKPPLRGEVTSRFGYRTHPIQGELLFHYGADISANKGADILSFAAGTVANTGKSDTYGNYVLIAHGDGVSSFYAHCSKILVRRGAKVKMGQAVAQVGSTGMSTGPHLHFELRLDGKLIDPEFYLLAE